MTVNRILAACQVCWPAHSGDCSGFAKAVAQKMGVPLDGMANDIVDTIRAGGNWTVLADGPAAAAKASAGALVLCGMRGDEESRPNPHGHVVVIVPGSCARGAYPHAYWGSLGGTGCQNQTINYAWVSPDRDNVTYAAWNRPAGKPS